MRRGRSGRCRRGRIFGDSLLLGRRLRQFALVGGFTFGKARVFGFVLRPESLERIDVRRRCGFGFRLDLSRRFRRNRRLDQIRFMQRNGGAFPDGGFFGLGTERPGDGVVLRLFRRLDDRRGDMRRQTRDMDHAEAAITLEVAGCVERRRSPQNDRHGGVGLSQRPEPF